MIDFPRGREDACVCLGGVDAAEGLIVGDAFLNPVRTGERGSIYMMPAPCGILEYTVPPVEGFGVLQPCCPVSQMEQL